MQAFLAKQNGARVVRHSFKTEASQQIDCIDINSQPGLHGGPIQSPPAAMPAEPESTSAPTQILYSETPDDDGNARQCPSGTIPIVRQTLADLQRFGSLDAYLSKHADGTSGLPPSTSPGIFPNSNHQYATTYAISAAPGGLETHINIWDPPVTAHTDEFSLSQIWVVGNPTNILPNYQSAEAGVQVFPQKYGDARLHLFIFATNDTWASGGGSCYNNDCGSFIQVNNSVALGAYYNSTSSQGGTQYEARFNIENNGGNSWWFGYQGTWIGYWDYGFYYPGRMDSNGADWAMAGGEIVNDGTNGVHTNTQMGSGVFPCEASPICGGNNCCSYYSDWQYVAYQRRLVQFNLSLQWSYADTSGTASNPNCYSYVNRNSSDGTWGDYFFFGGPGGSYYCP